MSAMTLRSSLLIDLVGMPRASDWQVREKLDMIEYGEQRRTINGELDTVIIPGFRKYRLSLSGAKARRPPALDGFFRGDTATIVPITALTFWIPAGATTVTLLRTPQPGKIKLRDDITGATLSSGVDWSQGGAPNQRVITLTAARANNVYGEYRFPALFSLDSRSSDFDEAAADGSWDMAWLEV